MSDLHCSISSIILLLSFDAVRDALRLVEEGKIAVDVEVDILVCNFHKAGASPPLGRRTQCPLKHYDIDIHGERKWKKHMW